MKIKYWLANIILFLSILIMPSIVFAEDVNIESRTVAQLEKIKLNDRITKYKGETYGGSSDSNLGTTGDRWNTWSGFYCIQRGGNTWLPRYLDVKTKYTIEKKITKERR